MKKYPKVVAIDFDETIGLYNPEKIGIGGYNPKNIYNVPNPRLIKIIKNLRKNKVKVIVYTSRWWGDYNSLSEWFKKYKIKVDDIILGRFKADVYICDKALNAHSKSLEKDITKMLKLSESWGMHYKKLIKKGKRNGKD